MRKTISTIVLIFLFNEAFSQLLVSRDTITVKENGAVLRMPWAGGLNYSNVTHMDVNYDGRKDLVAFDRVNLYGVGRFRCFIQTSVAGTYTSNPAYSYAFPFAQYWAICMDYDGDGKEDIFTSTSAGIKVFRNTGNSITGPQFTLNKSLLNTKYGPVATNLYAATNGIPGIADIDGDGDMDILTFSPAGIMVEYHRNNSIENYGHNDSLNDFQAVNMCWGNIIENNCSIATGQTCAPVAMRQQIKEAFYKSLHSGSCLTCMDTDDDGDQDLIAGDIGCNVALFGQNNGTAATAQITQTTNSFPNFPPTSNTVNINLNNFPCTYVVDVNNDGKKDLIASPNANGGENTKSIWYFQNVSSTNTVDLQLIKKNFLQDQMIEVGSAAYPLLMDENSDGLKDLVVGTHGYYISGSNRGQLTLYRNVGTNAVPSFSLVTRDYASLSSYSLNAAMPAAGDLDGDGDMDMLVGTMTGQIYWMNNTAGAGNPCAFSFSNTAILTTSSAIAAPQLFDIDQDQDLDLMIGCKNGKIFFYRNAGSVNTFSFSLVTGNFGGVNVQGNQMLYSIDGYAAPHFFTQGGNIKLLVGSISGQVYYYSVPSATAPCNLINANTNSIMEGGQSTVWYEDINNDGLPDLFVGNGSGGLSFFSSMGPDVKVKEEIITVKDLMVYPNPFENKIHVAVLGKEFLKGKIQMFDICGRMMREEMFYENQFEFESLNLQPGIYFVKTEITDRNGNSVFVNKMVKN